MTTVTTAANATAATSTTGTSAASLAGNFQTFLNLLTTQLKNQSPLDPLNTNEFTQQLVQFASVEQQLQSNESLTALVASTRAANLLGAASLVGSKVSADGATGRLANGTAEWRLQAPRAASATITISDSTGAVVATEKRSLAAGDQPFTWNGRTSAGGRAADGEYTVKVNALDPAGQTVAVRTEIQGTVEKMDLTGTEPAASIGNVIVPLSKVKTVQRL